jgi:SAM-dependent methyltransferase
MSELASFLSGEQLYGDAFTSQQIGQWYEDEREGYAQLGANDSESYRYGYHALNDFHAFRHLARRRFDNVLGLGSAYGDEFEPIASQIERLVILDPSDSFRRESVHGIPCTHASPSADGAIPFPSGSFDLVLCLGVLHHVPNVTRVVRELHRCLSAGGCALIREPIVSMGDWSRPRRGLTKRERGIPFPLFREIIRDAGFEVEREALCVFPLIPKLWQHFGGAAFNSPLATRLDAGLCRLMGWNLRYHATRRSHKLRPSSAYFVLSK